MKKHAKCIWLQILLRHRFELLKKLVSREKNIKTLALNIINYDFLTKYLHVTD